MQVCSMKRRILKGQRLHACVQKCSQQGGGVGTHRDDGWKAAWFCCYLCDICPVRRICAGRRAPVSVGRAWLCALLPVHGYVTFLPLFESCLNTVLISTSNSQQHICVLVSD